MGSLLEVRSNRIKSTLNQVIESLLGSKNFEIRVEYGAEKGKHFVGEIYRILFKQRSNHQWSSIILKMATQDEMRRNQITLHEYFEREIRIYQQIFPAFNDLQLSKGIDLNDGGFNECAKCYFTIDDEPFESLFLEDLNVNHFEMLDFRKDTLTFDHVSLVMKALGKFHAISFALKDQQPHLFADLTCNLRENYWTIENDHLNELFNFTKNQAIQALNGSNCHELSGRFAHAIEKGFAETGRDCVSSQFAEPYAVLCHGDVWINNTMFRNDVEGKPIEVKLFDFQFSRYASPVTDIIVYLLCCSRKALRDQYYDEFINIYYKSLSTLLRKLGSDPDKVFPFEALLDQLKRFGKYGTVTGSILMIIFFADTKKESEKIGDIKDAFQIPEELKETYMNTLRDMIEDAGRFGYI